MSRAVVWEAPLFENDPRAEGCPEDRAAWIWTSGEKDDFLAFQFSDGIPVRAKDFSQSKMEGPYMLPSM